MREATRKIAPAYRYKRLADELSSRIREGVLRPGDRIPSVRSTSRTRGMSPNTVLEAYYLLEDRGEIESRPRSGYFVCTRRREADVNRAAALPQAAIESSSPTDLGKEMLAAIAQPQHVHFAGGWPNGALFPLRKLARALKKGTSKLDLDQLTERHAQGNSQLKRFVMRRAVEWGYGGDGGEVILTAGALEAINVCLDAVTRPGDLVAVESVAAYNQLGAIERHGLRPVLLGCDPKEGASLADLSTALKKHPVRACLLMPNFQNPLGSLMPDEKKRELVRLLHKHGVPLIENDVYGELHYGAARPLPAKAFDRHGLVLHCASFSKCLAPGYSVGWALAGRFAARVQHSKWMTNTVNGVLTQAALIEYLRHGGFEHHLRRLRSTLASLHRRALEVIGAHFPRGTLAEPVAGGYMLWVRLPAGVNAVDVYRLALRQGITVAPGPVFSSGRRVRQGMRLNFAHDLSPRRDAALATLGRIVSSLS